jgi:hypothetical protein
MRLKPTHTYEVIASAFRASQPDSRAHVAARVQWEHDVRSMAHALRADNPAFRLDLFFQQAGIGEV